MGNNKKSSWMHLNNNEIMNGHSDSNKKVAGLGLGLMLFWEVSYEQYCFMTSKDVDTRNQLLFEKQLTHGSTNHHLSYSCVTWQCLTFCLCRI